MDALGKVQSSIGALSSLGVTDRRPDVGRISISSYLLLGLQLLLISWVIYRFRIEEGAGFLRILPLIVGGFLVHSLLPLQLRPPLLLSLGLLAIAINLGYPHGVMLVGAGVGLFALAHVPVRFWIRVALLMGAAAVLIALRAEWIQTRWTALPVLVVPVLASMFMFRMIIYMYDSRHLKSMGNIWERLSYFFMLPNVAFLLFPVVDFQTYKRSYYNDDAASVYQKGLAWITRGVLHLVLYRLIYYYWIPAPEDVTSILSLAQYMLATYLLYLRVSGQFHVIVGILCLFGYNLPETHHLYYLASSFNDFWRRINIYWKDFMMKIFYYPSFMKLRKLGMAQALVLSTIIVFLGTWLLHAYQWFWLRGTFLLTATDVLFWTILGLLVVVNSVWEAKRGRRRSLGEQKWSAIRAVIHGLKVLAMFVTLTILWTFWSSPNLGVFGSLVAAASHSPAYEWAQLALILVSMLAIGVAVQYLRSRGFSLTAVGAESPSGRTAIMSTATALALLCLTMPQVRNLLGDAPAALALGIQEERLNPRDEQLMERGYYEGLLTSSNFTSALWQSWRPKEWGLDEEYKFVRRTDDLYKKVLIPNSDVEFCGAPLQTNRWGMRDQDYTLEKPAGTYRIALLGDSHVLGMGVANDETFEAVMERRLNDEFMAATGQRIEVLNFAVTAYTLIQQVIFNEEQVPRFHPDAVVFVSHPGERDRTLQELVSRIRRDTDLHYPYLDSLQQRSGVSHGMQELEIKRRLEPFGDELLDWTYRHIAQTARRRGMVPFWVFMPLTHLQTPPEELDDLQRRAGVAGFETISLDGAYAGQSVRSITVAPWDNHPNARAHRFVADRLYEELVQHPELIRFAQRSR